MENGYFISYAPIFALSNLDKNLSEDRRHIAILTVKKDKLVLPKSEVPILKTKWELVGEPTDPLNKNFIPQPSDSGAGFIVKKGTDYYVAGIHKGRAIFTNDANGKQEVKTLIVPLYPYKSWIEEICRKYD